MTANTTIIRTAIGCTSCMSETISVKDKDGNPIRIHVHYDSGSQHSLGSKLINRVVLAKRTSNNPIVLSTVSGETNEIQQLSLVKLSDMHNIEIICVPSMDINSFNITIPQQFKNIKGQWATPTLSWERYRLPQVLIGSHCHNLMPIEI